MVEVMLIDDTEGLCVRGGNVPCRFHGNVKLLNKELMSDEAGIFFAQ